MFASLTHISIYLNQGVYFGPQRSSISEKCLYCMNKTPVYHKSVLWSKRVQESIQLYVVASIILDVNGHKHTHPQSPTQSIKQILILTSSNTDYHNAS